MLLTTKLCFLMQVVLRTSIGDLDVELWPKEAPRAVRNFVQLCMEGYYNNTIFHRIVKDFLVQGGDPTGSGTGGESIYGHPFRDEFHSRLRFSHRGIVACANKNVPDSNGSQFFITLGKVDHLDRKATIFGKITGDTIYNLAKFNEIETDSEDRPLDSQILLLRADVIWNPFEDIKPRAIQEMKAEKASHEETRKKSTQKPSRNLKLISFGEEAEETLEGPDESQVGMRSAHEVLEDKRLLKEPAMDVDLEKVRQAIKQASSSLSSKRKQTDKIAERRIESPQNVSTKEVTKGSGTGLSDQPAEVGKEKRKSSRIDSRFTQAVTAPSRQIEIVDKDLLTRWQRRREELKERKRVGGRREKDTMSKLNKFISKIQKSNVPKMGVEDPRSSSEPLLPESLETSSYAGKVNTQLDHRAYMPPSWRIDTYLDTAEDEDHEGQVPGGDSLEALRGHRLDFSSGLVKDNMSRKDSIDDYVVHDPLLEAGKTKFHRDQLLRRKAKTEWAGGSRN
jgi:peptidyl-prolyl cis-trans isomerase SDCCAG10